MKKTVYLFAVGLAGAAASLLSGCAGTGSASTPESLSPAGMTTTQTQVALAADRSGFPPNIGNELRFGQPLHVQPDKSAAPKLLAVSDFGTQDVEVLNKKYALKTTISNGLAGPDGDFYDGNGNLYVANFQGPYVVEYAENGTSPIMTYSSDLSDPVNVTADKNGNVYVADYVGERIVEFPQGSNTPSAVCATGVRTVGVAVDKKGDVFASGNTNSSARIVEFRGGISGSSCSGAALAVSLNQAGGLQVDAAGDLLACDLYYGVDIIPPPYDAISSKITGGSSNSNVALNKSNSLAFIADPSDGYVLVTTYPGGSELMKLGSSDGISTPGGVATFPFAGK